MIVQVMRLIKKRKHFIFLFFLLIVSFYPLDIQGVLSSDFRLFSSVLKEDFDQGELFVAKSDYSYDTITIWNNTNIELNKTLKIASITHFIITNCTVTFTSLNNTPVGIEVEENSRLDIFDSYFHLKNSEGQAYLKFNGNLIKTRNSTFQGLGYDYYNPGFLLKNATGTIENCSILRGYNGVVLENCYNLQIRNTRICNNSWYGVIGSKSTDICIENSTFEYHNYDGILFRESKKISIENCHLRHILSIPLNFVETNDTLISGNTIEYFGPTSIILGGSEFQWFDNDAKNAVIKKNRICNGTGKGIFIRDSFSNVTILGNNFTDIKDICIDFKYSDVEIRNNNINHVGTGIVRQDLRMGVIPPQFSIIGNNISFCEREGIYLLGVTADAIIQKNIINNTKREGIVGKPRVSESGNAWGGLINTIIYQNAFLNCNDGATSWGLAGQPYSFVETDFDNGFFGNFWEEYNGPDEDGNFIGDTKFVVCPNYGLYDSAPLLSLDYITKELSIISTHPQDRTLWQSDLRKENLIWQITCPEGVDITVAINGTMVAFNKSGTFINVSLENLVIGKNNLTLVIRSFDENYFYCDLVWITVLRDESNVLELTEYALIFGSLVIISLLIFWLFKWVKR